MAWAQCAWEGGSRLSTSTCCSLLPDYPCKAITAQVLATKTLVMVDCKRELWTRCHFFLKLLRHCNKVSNKHSPYRGTLWNLIVEWGSVYHRNGVLWMWPLCLVSFTEQLKTAYHFLRGLNVEQQLQLPGCVSQNEIYVYNNFYCVPMLRAVLFTIASNWYNPKYL